MGKLSGVNLADGIAVVVVILTAVSGLRRGLVTGVTSLSGLIVGTMVGVRVAPDLVGGASGAYVPLIALAGAALGGMVGQSFGVLVGRYAHQVIDALPPLRMLDSAGESRSARSPGSRSAGRSGRCCSTSPARPSCAGSHRSRSSCRPSPTRCLRRE